MQIIIPIILEDNRTSSQYNFLSLNSAICLTIGLIIKVVLSLTWESNPFLIDLQNWEVNWVALSEIMDKGISCNFTISHVYNLEEFLSK